MIIVFKRYLPLLLMVLLLVIVVSLLPKNGNMDSPVLTGGHSIESMSMVVVDTLNTREN